MKRTLIWGYQRLAGMLVDNKVTAQVFYGDTDSMYGKSLIDEVFATVLRTVELKDGEETLSRLMLEYPCTGMLEAPGGIRTVHIQDQHEGGGGDEVGLPSVPSGDQG